MRSNTKSIWAQLREIGNSMAYRNGTHVAFDALGETDPTKSDFRYYSIIEAWSTGKNIDFRYVNSHDKTYAVRDYSLRSTLTARIRARLAASKNCLVILSSRTRKTGSVLSYEIQRAVDYYKIPLIVTYTGYCQIMAPQQLSNQWPMALGARIRNRDARAIHIPFKKGAILDAISQFAVQKDNLEGSLHYYSKEAHINLGCVEG